MARVLPAALALGRLLRAGVVTVYYSAWALPGPPERCRFTGMGLAILTDTEALHVLRLAGGRHGHLVAVRCEPCRGWHIRPRTERTR